MNNEVDITSDGINVYVSLRVVSNKIANAFLILVNCLVLVILTLVLSKINIKEEPKLILPIIIVPCLFFYFVGRYCLWNLYGIENIIINKNSLSSSFDYGWYKTNLKTQKVGELGVGFEVQRVEGETKKGDLIIVDYANEARLPLRIYTTSVLISEDKAEVILEGISKIFISDLDEEYDFVPFSEN
ncbi:hypothetical protein C8N26_0150 [Tenacibaculum lutimaris]|uniref:Uncharacterized protein n=1 Tax=Tenacibaculum lutimaris TaxID=285258 RepID=A0A420E3N7_9FLAO|nr:hypothetical protein [Tenacibaculum lutimaris]RKF04761.1 hypothetical protein C8N26_0150 [Tenacibaculum lutimaris]